MTRRAAIRGLASAVVAAVAASRAARAGTAGAGVATVEVPLDGDFASVRIALPADVSLRPAAGPSVRVTAARDVLPAVRVRRVGDELVVDAARSFRTRETLRVEIGYRRLRRIRVEGAGDVAVDGPRDGALELDVQGTADVRLAGLNLSALKVHLAGSATVVADGTATEQTVGVAGSATYEAGRLRSRRVVIDLEGSSDATVDVSERLVATVDGTATVRYRGSPAVERRVGGVGSVERI